VSYKELRSGSIKIKGKNVQTVPLSSYVRAKEIAGILKQWIQKGRFTLTEPVAKLPDEKSNVTVKMMKER